MPSLLCCRGLLVDLLEELSGCSDAPEALPRGPGALLQQIPLPQVGAAQVGLRFLHRRIPTWYRVLGTAWRVGCWGVALQLAGLHLTRAPWESVCGAPPWLHTLLGRTLAPALGPALHPVQGSSCTEP